MVASTCTLRLLCLFIGMTQFTVRYSYGRDIYVSHGGNDTKDCGHVRTKSCKTIAYAVSLSEPNDIIDLENTGGPYTVQPKSGDFVNITHSLRIRSLTGHSVMNCTKNNPRMFDIFGEVNSSTLPIFTLQNVKIQNCIGDWDNPSLIRISNANIKIQDCEFVNSAVVLHHPQIGGSPCNQVKVDISRSKFTACGISKPYMPSIILMGCNSTSVIIKESAFMYSGVQFQGDQNLTLNIDTTAFQGHNLRGPSLDIIMAPKQSQIALTDSTICCHDNSQDSSVRISLEVPTASPSIHFNNVSFSGNEGSKASVSLLTKFSKVPLNMNVQFALCTFTGNTAKSLGGAIYMVNVDTVKINHSNFKNNSAVDGGALFILNSNHVTLYNSTFTSNKATGVQKQHYKGVGGAIRAIKTVITTTQCTFSKNSAKISGQAIHATDMISAYIENCEFVNATSGDSKMQTELFLKQTYANDSPSASPAVMLSDNTYDSIITDNQHGMFHVEVKGEMQEDNNKVCCPMGQHVDYMSQPQYPEGYDPGSSINTAWCTTCPMGTYNLQRQCQKLKSSNMYEDHPIPMCEQCPEFAKCTGSGRIAALRNYWGSRTSNQTNTVVFQLCPPQYCDKPSCQDIECCSNGRTGSLCGQCLDGHHLNLATDECVHNSECQYFTIFTVLYAVAFGAVYFSIILLFVILTSFCLAPFPTVVANQQIQSDSHTPWEPSSIHSSIRDGDRNIPASSNPFNTDGTSMNNDGDSGSDSFEPSLPSEFNHSVDSHGLVPVQNEETQTSDRENKEITVKTQSNLLIGHPFVLCVVWMLVQLTEDTYQPWYGTDDKRHPVINGILDVIHFRPVYYLLNTPCIHGNMAGVLKIPLQIICIAVIFIILIMILTCGNIIAKVITRTRGCDISLQTAQMNAALSQMFMTTLVLCYFPILKSCFRLIHCVHNSSSNEIIMFINGTVACNHWWHTFVIVILVINLVPVGLCIWTGLPLLKARHITTLKFAVGLVFPLPASVYWLCRYGKSVCHCLFPYEFHYDVMQSGLYEMNPEYFLPVDVTRSFFTNPFLILCQAHKRTPAHLADGRHAWIIFIFLRIFILATFSTMLSHWPVIKTIVIVILLLFGITLHTYWQPYGRRSANRIEGYFLGFQAILGILGMSNSLVYSMGNEPYGYLKTMLHVNDWIFVTIMSLILVLYLSIIVHYLIKACRNKRRNRV